MALIKCSNCGNSVSDKANTCPSCGFKVKNKTNNKIILYIVSGLLLCFLILGIYFIGNKESENQEEIYYYDVVVDVYYNGEDFSYDAIAQYINDIFNYYDRLDSKKKEKLTLNKYDISIKANEDKYNEVASKVYSGYGTPLIILNNSFYYRGVEDSKKVINTIEDLLRNRS